MNMVVSEAEGGMVIIYPLFFPSVIHLSGGWILELMYMYVLISLNFLLIRQTTLEPY